MKIAAKLIRDKRVRFILVGGLNTLVDFTLYTTLRLFGVDLFIANFISTSCGMTLSYTLNRNFTFKTSSNKKKREIVLFLVVTAFGLWVIQPITIAIFQPIIGNIDSKLFATLIPKILATILSLIWNYFMYSRLVFVKEKTEKNEPN